MDIIVSVTYNDFNSWLEEFPSNHNNEWHLTKRCPLLEVGERVYFAVKMNRGRCVICGFFLVDQIEDSFRLRTPYTTSDIHIVTLVNWHQIPRRSIKGFQGTRYCITLQN